MKSLNLVARCYVRNNSFDPEVGAILPLNECLITTLWDDNKDEVDLHDEDGSLMSQEDVRDLLHSDYTFIENYCHGHYEVIVM